MIQSIPSPGAIGAGHQTAPVDDAIRLHEPAVASLQNTLATDPDNVTTLIALADAMEKLARHDEAIACFRRAVAVRPDNARAHVGLGNVLYARARYDDAMLHYERALLLQPDNADLLNNLGNALAALGRYDEAVARYEQAIALTAEVAMPQHNLATALQAMHRPDDALVQYERALALAPDLVEAQLGIAIVLRQLGRFDAAHRAFESAIRIAPGRISAYFGLGVSKQFAVDDPHLATLEAFAREPSSLSEEDRIYLHFALGKAYDDLGQHARSFAHLLEGNRLKRRQIAYDEANALGFMDACPRIFTPEFFRTMAGHGDASRVPVFFVGMLRSGSTLVEQILASHPHVFGGGERPYFEQSLMAAPLAVQVRAQQVHPEANRPEANKPKTNVAVDGAWIGALAEGYLRALTAIAPTALRITDKLLGNLIHVGFIHLALPNARIIHVSRDPLDTCLSCFSNLFSVGATMTYDLAELGRYYRHYQQLMAHWHSVLPEGVMIDVRYEDVVADLEGQARRIVAHCGLEWDAACLEFYRTERPVRTASAVQVRQPLFASSVGRAQRLRNMLGPLLEALTGELAAEPARS